LIRPIPDFPAPDNTPAPQPKAPTAPVSQNHQQRAPEESIAKNLSRPPKTTSLKTLIKEKEAEATIQPISHESLTQSTPFNEEDLIQCWDAYSEALEENAHLKNTMINCKPVLLEHFNFEVRVHNPVQQEALLSNSLDILKVLRTRLKNDRVQMHIRIVENMDKKTAYTAAEKFEFLHNINPLLSKLIDEFDLTSD